MSKQDKIMENYLENIPVIKFGLKTSTNYLGEIIIYKENNNFFDKVLQKLFSKPRISKIHLDKVGAFVWKQIDGEKNIIEIGRLLKNEFGQEVEPLFERLSLYFRSLIEQDFIYFL